MADRERFGVEGRKGLCTKGQGAESGDNLVIP